MGYAWTVGDVISPSESESCSVASDSLQPHGLYSQWNSPGQNTGVGSCSLLQHQHNQGLWKESGSSSTTRNVEIGTQLRYRRDEA